MKQIFISGRKTTSIIVEPAELRDLILLCLHDNPKERPMISKVCAAIEEIRTHCPKQCSVTAGTVKS